MRAIKFRAWHKGRKGTSWIDSISPGMIYEDRPGDVFRWLEENQPIEIMQFTGLTDKKGKEIYEGDVVKWETESHENWETKPCTKISFVEYRNKGFWIHDESFGYEGEELWDWKEIEVIGNRFEHPNLIK